MGPDDVCFLRSEARQTEFFVILSHFLHFYTTNNPKNQNFEKMKKKKKKKTTPGEFIILHKCTKNHDHMLYCSWDMACDGCNCYFSFWAIFCPFTPLTVQKNQFFLKMKETPGNTVTPAQTTTSIRRPLV